MNGSIDIGHGSGIHRMLDACVAAGLPEPTIEEATSGVVITFRKMTRPEPDVLVETPVSEQVSEQVAGEVTGEVAGEVLQFLHVLTEGPCTRSEAQAKLDLKGQANFRDRYLVPALTLALIEMTIPDKPRSRLQKYRLTTKGRKMVNDER